MSFLNKLNCFKKKVKTENVEAKGNHKWKNKAQFILSLVGLSVGLGNIWRFPSLAYKNGGGAFLIPYVIVYVLAGLPNYILELAIGQFTGRGPSHAYNMTKVWRGIGWCMALLSIITAMYYNVIIAWVFHYLFGSMRSRLIWADCTNSWNDVSCITRETVFGVPTQSIFNNETVTYCNGTSTENCISGVFATTQYFKNHVLHLSDSVDNYGTPYWDLVLCLLLAWIIVGGCLLFGIESSGNAIYITATFPYVILVVLLIRGLLLEGSTKGIIYYVTPKFERLLDINTWYAAATQVYFSLGLAYGGLVAYSSHNQFKNNFFRDAMIVVAVDGCTSIVGGFATFSILGHMASKNDIPIDKIVNAGTGLVFVVYPEALAEMPVGQLFSILFFLMLLMLGLSSEFSMVETAINTFDLQFGITKKSEKLRPLITVITCCVLFLGSLFLCCPGGFYLFEVLNTFTGGQCLLAVGLLEFIIISYIYGFNNFMEDIKLMLSKRKFEYLLFITWCIISPLIVFIVIILLSVTMEPMVVNGVVLPQWTIILGWVVFAIILIPIPIFAFIEIYKGVKIKNSLRKPNMPAYIALLKYLHQPMKDWGPTDNEGKVDKYAHLAEPTLENNEDYFNKAFDILNEPEVNEEKAYNTEKF